MPHESSSVQKLDSTEEKVLRAREIFQQLQAIDLTKVRCMMGIVVSDSPEDAGDIAAHTYVLGTKKDIAKMFSSLVTVTYDNLVQTDTPPTHNDEVEH